MPLYEPLREGFRDLSNMLRESQRFDAQQTNIRAAQQRKGELDQANLQMQYAEADRQAKARDLFSKKATSVLGADPYTDISTRVEMIPNEISGLKLDVKGMKGAPIDAKARLSANTRIAGLEAELRQKQGQLADPVYIANMYHRKARDLTELSGQMGAYDLKSAGLLTQHAGIALNQGDQFLAQARMEQARKDQVQPVEEMAYVLDKDGKMISSEQVMYNKVAGEAYSPVEASPGLQKHIDAGNQVVWKAQYDATAGPKQPRQPKEYIFKSRNQLRTDLLGKETIVPPSETQNAAADFTLTLYDTFALKQNPQSEAESQYLAALAKRQHRKLHNKYLTARRKMNAELAADVKAKIYTRDEAADIKARWDQQAANKFNYIPTQPYDRQIKRVGGIRKEE